MAQPLALDVSGTAADRVYAVMAAAPALHPQMLALIRPLAATDALSMSQTNPIR